MEEVGDNTGTNDSTRSQIGTTPPRQDSRLTKTAIASFVGTAIEYYDFLAYGLAAATVFGQLFFPGSDPTVATLLSFATFTSGFLARPVGGLIFGHFGDRMGRRGTLITVLLLMGGATTCIGLLPTHHQVGMLAPVLLVALRLIQGFAAGGEFGGAVLLIVEHAPAHRRGLYGSTPVLGVAVGATLATLAFTMLNGLSAEAFASWGWRIPFLFSAVLVVFGLWVRLSVDETPAFLEEKKRMARTAPPIVQVIRSYWKETLLSAGILFGYISFGYVVITYTISYGTTVAELSRRTLLTTQLLGGLAAFVTIPLFGHLSDRVGRKPVILGGVVFVMFMSYLLFILIDSGSFALLLVAYILASPGAQAIHAPAGALFPELFGTGARYSGVSLGYQLGAVLGGGFAPTIAALLYASFHTAHAVATYTMLCAVVSGICVLLLGSVRQDVSPEEVRRG